MDLIGKIKNIKLSPKKNQLISFNIQIDDSVSFLCRKCDSDVFVRDDEKCRICNQANSKFYEIACMVELFDFDIEDYTFDKLVCNGFIYKINLKFDGKLNYGIVRCDKKHETINDILSYENFIVNSKIYNDRIKRDDNYNENKI